ncbi:hypothetical protein AB0M46_04535 [Dactylosporangium sp. NPDC051485]|uniref:hypothetical protein n=1 Tax=Dactylosporangium sp. NPDC051485 TaxID=3154846 RepID=UPI003418B9A8
MPDLLRVGAAPWVEALVVAIREDQEVEGPAPQVRDTDDATQLTFFASRQTTEVVGGRPVLDVSRWTVRIPKAPHGAPAAWDCEAVADAVPLAPPW